MENQIKNNPLEKYVTSLYYMTNIKNLPRIMREGILSYDRARKGNKIPTSIANPDVQELRERERD